MMTDRFAAGHELHPIRRRAAAATPSQWEDAIVTAISSDGTIELSGVFDGTHREVWHHNDLTNRLAVGSAVAYHVRYGVVALGRDWISVSALHLDRAL